MRVALLAEQAAGERRVAATPETVKKLIALGATVMVEQGAGTGASIVQATSAPSCSEPGSATVFVGSVSLSWFFG